MAELVRRQFVQGLTIADLSTPTQFREWFRLLGITQWPNLALVIRLQPVRQFKTNSGAPAVSDLNSWPPGSDLNSPSRTSVFLLSDRLKSSLRDELSRQLLEFWPNLLLNWQEDLELVTLLTRPDLISKFAITEAVLQSLEKMSLSLRCHLFAGVSRSTESTSLLSAAIRSARHAAKEAEQEGRLLLHVDDIEEFTDTGLKQLASQPERKDLAAGSPLETELRQTKEVLLSYQGSHRIDLDAAKRQILEKFVSLMNTSRISGIAIDAEALTDSKLFEELVKAETAAKLALWVEQRGLAFLDSLSGLAEQSKPRIIQEAISYLAEHLPEDLSLEVIASHCNVSHYYLSHLFRKETGTTVTAFIKKARIDQAMVLLRDPSLTIAEVAYKVGYQDANYFSKSFRSYIGVSPTEFRNL